MTKKEREQQKTDDVLLAMEGLSWYHHRARSWVRCLHGSDGTQVARITRPRKRYYAYLIPMSVGGPFPTLARAKRYISKKLVGRGGKG